MASGSPIFGTIPCCLYSHFYPYKVRVVYYCSGLFLIFSAQEQMVIDRRFRIVWDKACGAGWS